MLATEPSPGASGSVCALGPQLACAPSHAELGPVLRAQHRAVVKSRDQTRGLRSIRTVSRKAWRASGGGGSPTRRWGLWARGMGGTQELMQGSEAEESHADGL